ncbi:hypothetical protein AB205_0072910 [Aquarana catesbeiana]|uniref:Uncharacterized protein n=1 Tax=Aquarana catesbeiana TaxID=8400 RepID=A0A2G9RYK3_AQUCT|nr:hypothetical protein AB205_0072910 [Aquarana catesbeiana]
MLMLEDTLMSVRNNLLSPCPPINEALSPPEISPYHERSGWLCPLHFPYKTSQSCPTLRCTMNKRQLQEHMVSNK